jgi:hypothetical protein
MNILQTIDNLSFMNLNNSLNPKYTEKSLWIFTDDIKAHLALQMEIPRSTGFKIRISDDWVEYDAFEKDEMNTVRQVLTLLVVAVSKYEDEWLQRNWVVELPKNSVVWWVSQEDGWDLFEQFPFNAKTYSLFKAYHILTNKLLYRNTPLFQVLYICTCLELWRLGVAPEIVVWPIGRDVHWGDLILQMMWDITSGWDDFFKMNWFIWFTDSIINEIDRISESEIPDNILRNLYEKEWVWSKKEVMLVTAYLDKIMSESRWIKPIK